MNGFTRRLNHKRRGDYVFVSIVIWAIVIAVVGLSVYWLNYEPRPGIQQELAERGYANVRVGDRKWFSLCGKYSTGYSFDATGPGRRVIKDGSVCVNWAGYSVWD